jgi:hypothetical protein
VVVKHGVERTVRRHADADTIGTDGLRGGLRNVEREAIAVGSAAIRSRWSA